ncbi:MAG: hypothetical protein LBO71_08410 [Prevotellaceae bacterium]|jgi:hypothetical protein|nr:hypothetical protein [Prevotellaceae bacterium]
MSGTALEAEENDAKAQRRAFADYFLSAFLAGFAACGLKTGLNKGWPANSANWHYPLLFT